MHGKDIPATDSLRKSFKSHGSCKQVQKNQDEIQEESLVHFDKEGTQKSVGFENDSREVVVKIDGERDIEVSESNENTWRGPSYRFWQRNENIPGGEFDFQQVPTLDDSSTKLIREAIDEKKETGQTSLQVELGVNEQPPQPWFPPVKDMPNQLKQQSKELRVSFQEHSVRGADLASNTMRRRHKTSDDEDEVHNNEKLRTGIALRSGEVTRCTSNASFKKNPDILRSKTKSRLLDPKQQDVAKSGKLKSGMLKSGVLGVDEDDEDPFFGEDIPDGFKKENLGAATILEWVSLITILVLFIASLLIPRLKQEEVLNLHIWKWEVLFLVLICGRMVSGWVIKIAVFFIERNFLLHRRVLYFVYAVRKSVQHFLWLSMVLIAWHFLFDKKVQLETKTKHLPYITKTLICLLVATLVNLIKTVLVKSLASSFHVNAYFDRIQDALFNQYVIETLSGPPLIEIQHNKEEEERVVAEIQRLQNAGAKIPADLRAAILPSQSTKVQAGSAGGKTFKVSSSVGRKSFKLSNFAGGKSFKVSSSVGGKSFKSSGAIPRGLNDEGIKIEQLSKLNPKTVSAWNMKRLMNIVRHGVLCTLDESIQDATQEDDNASQIRNEFEAKAAAKKIFNNVAKPGCKFICLMDLMRFMREDEAVKVLCLFEGAKEKHKVNKTALKNWVVMNSIC